MSLLLNENFILLSIEQQNAIKSDNMCKLFKFHIFQNYLYLNK
jgi:hypothetical protein